MAKPTGFIEVAGDAKFSHNLSMSESENQVENGSGANRNWWLSGAYYSVYKDKDFTRYQDCFSRRDEI